MLCLATRAAFRSIDRNRVRTFGSGTFQIVWGNSPSKEPGPPIPYEPKSESVGFRYVWPGGLSIAHLPWFEVLEVVIRVRSAVIIHNSSRKVSAGKPERFRVFEAELSE